MANQWFRLYHEFATDPKVQMLSEADQRRFIMLMCLRCSNGDETFQSNEIAFQLRISNEEWEETKATLMAKNLIDEDAKPTAWDKRQTNNFLRQSPEVWKKTRQRIFSRDNYTCQYCGAYGVQLECDHIIPVSKGGSNEDDNLVTACFHCNRSKHTKLIQDWLKEE